MIFIKTTYVLRYIFAVTLSISCLLLPSFSNAQSPRPIPITNETVLPDFGKSTCTFAFYRSKYTNLAHLCKATLLSSSQIIIDPECNMALTRLSSAQIFCKGKAISADVSHSNERKDLTSGLRVIKLASPLDLAPLALANESEGLALLNKPYLCKITTDKETISLFPKFTIDKTTNPLKISQDSSLTKESVGGTVSCLGSNGEEKVVGVLDKNLDIIPSWEIKNETEDIIEKRNITIRDDSIDPSLEVTQLCRSGLNCLSVLSEEAKELSVDIGPVLTSLFNQHQEQQQKLAEKSSLSSKDELYTEMLRLQDLFRDTLQACHQQQIALRQSLSSAPEASLSSSYLGGITNWFASQYSRESLADIILDGAYDKDTERLLGTKESLRQKIVTGLTLSEELGLDETKAIAQEAYILASDTVKQMLIQDFKMSEDDPRLKDIIENGLSGFKQCLDASQNAQYDIKSCVSKFKETIPVTIGRSVLDLNLEKQFKDSFNDDSGYLRLTQRANQIYDRCSSVHYFANENKAIGPNQRTSACVYSSILAAFDHTAKATLEEIVGKFESSPSKRDQLINQIRQESYQKCDMSQTMVDADKMTHEQFKALSLINQDDLEKNILECKDIISLTAAPSVFEKTLLTNEDFLKAFPNLEERALEIERLKTQFFNPCLELLKIQGPTGKIDATRCEGFVEMEATISVTNKIMDKTIEEQIEKLYGSNKSSEEKQRDISELKLRTRHAMLSCHNELQTTHYAALRNMAEQPTENEMIQCLSQGIRHIAENVANKTLEVQINGDPDLKKIETKIYEHPQIQNIAKATGDCFELRLNQIETVSALSPELESIQNQCILKTEKDATLTIGSILIEEKVSVFIADPAERQAFVTNIIEGDDGLRRKFEEIETKEELEEAVAGIQTTVTMAYAKDFVPSSISNYLNGNIPNAPELTEELSRPVLADLEKCTIEAQKAPKGTQQAKAYENCNSMALAQATESVAKTLIEHNISSNVSDTKASEELSNQSNERVTSCIEIVKSKVDQLTAKEFEAQVNQCISKEIFIVSRDVPKLVLSSVSSLAGSTLTPNQLKRELAKVDDFYYNGKSSQNISTDPAVSVYQSLVSCLMGQEYEYNNSGQQISQALEGSSHCTDQLKEHITYGVKTNFIGSRFPGQKGSHTPALSKTIDILMELTGKSEESDASMDLSETLQLVGKNIVLMCNYNPPLCEQSALENPNNPFAKTLALVKAAKERNPNISSTALQDIFYNSPLMKQVIEANIATTLRTELYASLRSMDDGSGALSREIVAITSPSIFNRIMQSADGARLQEMLIAEVKKGNIDNASKSPRVRRLLAQAIGKDDGNNGFIDRLMYGVVQPKINKERNSLKGSLGRLIGAVKGDSFDWLKIRNTPEGKEARMVFAGLLKGGITEEIQLSNPNGTKSATLVDQEKRITDLIEKAIRRL